jgi:hypothetical protein
MHTCNSPEEMFIGRIASGKAGTVVIQHKKGNANYTPFQIGEYGLLTYFE